MDINNIKDKLERATIAVATADKQGKPHNIAIMYAKVRDDKIVITNNYMKTTVNNLKENNKISLVFWQKEKGWRIDGEAEYFDSGEWLDFVKDMPENKDMPCKGAVVINVKEIKELG